MGRSPGGPAASNVVDNRDVSVGFLAHNSREEDAQSFKLGDLPIIRFDVARRGYAMGSAVLEAVLPPHDGPTMFGDGLDLRDGIEAKRVVLDQLASALEVIRHYHPARIATFGVSARGARRRSVSLPAATARTWRSSGSTRTLTSAPQRVNTRATTR